MYIHNLNPTLLHLGSLEIRWYGLVYVLGFFLTIWWMQYLVNKGKLNLENDDVWDLGFYLILGTIVGARIFMIFWNPEVYLFKPWNLLKIWEGGMSFHGGFVGIVTACYIYCNKKRLNFWKIADILSVPTIFALALGRVANFINGELWGRTFDGKWCVNFKNTGGGDVCRHPSTLYAAGKRFIVFGWLLFLSFKNELKPGFIFWNLVFWEGLGRFVVDFYRENALSFGLSLGQWFSLLMIIVAIYAFMKYYKNDCKKIYQLRLHSK
jgi:phosphatidylglycerol---prolipoprotein diacylglyceryl transferase